MVDVITPTSSRHVEPDLVMDGLVRIGSEVTQDNLLPFYNAINKQQSQVSALQQIATNYPIVLGNNVLISGIETTAYVVGENNQKIASDGAFSNQVFHPFKVAGGVVYSMESERRANPQILSHIISSISAGIAKQVDVAGILGRQASTGEQLENSHVKSIAENSHRINISESFKPDAALIAAAQQITEAGHSPTGIITTPKFQSALLAQTDKEGRRIYGDGTVLGGNFGAAVGIPQTVVTKHLDDRVNPDRIVAVIGDFSQLIYGVVDLGEWEYNRYTLGDPFSFGYDLASRNQVALRLETMVAVGVADPDAFVTISLPGTPARAKTKTA